MILMIYIQLLGSMSTIALSAYIFNQYYISKKLFCLDKEFNKFALIVFFSLLSILGTYTGVNIDSMAPASFNKSTLINLNTHAIANTRPIGAITAGYLGGPLVGICVGLIAGLQRYYVGGFTALACAVATIMGGICSGLARKHSKSKTLNPKLAFITTIIAEILEMIIILILSKPFNHALQLEKIFALPMIIINSVGVFVFVYITKDALEQYNRIGATEAQKALNIAEKTLNYFKKGFDKDNSEKIAKIIWQNTSFESVFIADTKKMISYYGEDINSTLLNESLKNYYKSADYKIVKYRDSSSETVENIFFCIPIYDENNLELVIGLNIVSESFVDKYFTLFVKQLSTLLSNQLKLYKLNKIANEVYVAEFKALKAQIHPHFLFNALNTISSFCRTNPNKARELILNLSSYFRQTLKREEDFITIKEEYDFLNSYLSIENARFGERLKVNINFPKNLLNYKIPVFLLQPLVENSINHGILPKPSGGTVIIEAYSSNENLNFIVKDNGVGMKETDLKKIHSFSTGIGLNNVNERLKLLFGEEYKINIKSNPNKGTSISFSIPKEMNL
ncbi:histidine kinase [Clostridium tetani]|nr:histidine kinase [Clostridium tetani]